MAKSLCSPVLSDCELAFRIDMVRKRLRAYPLDSMNFILLDLERPAAEHRQADWWTGDLTGRILEFVSFAEGVTKETCDWLPELYDRILRTRQPSGLFGVDNKGVGHNKLLMGFLRHYAAFGDQRSLDAAIGIGRALASDTDRWMNPEAGVRCPGFAQWMTEPFAELYRLTGEKCWADVQEKLLARAGEMERKHAHNYLTSMRGLQYMAMATGDAKWAELPEAMRRRAIERKYIGPAGDVCEGLPWTNRNEACATADWIRVNLCAGFMNNDDSAYEQAEHALVNALYFAQIVTGGMGHRALAPWGYGVKEFQEAWWCCTMNGGLAYVDMARHAVTLDGDTLRVNFLIPGTFTLTRHGKPVVARVATRWPIQADATVTVTGETDGLRVRVREPKCVKSPKCAVKNDDGTLTVRFTGEIGYTLDAWQDGTVVLHHGCQMLAPMDQVIGAGYPGSEFDNDIPEGYRNGTMPSGWLTLIPPARDERGFYDFRHDPIPDWTYFEEGPSSRTGSGDLSVSCDAVTEDGAKKRLRFWPLSYAISTLVFYATPIVFRLGDGKREE